MNELPDIEELRRTVRSCGLSYNELAERSGLSKSWISQFSRGLQQNPRYHSLEALMKALPDSDPCPR